MSLVVSFVDVFRGPRIPGSEGSRVQVKNKGNPDFHSTLDVERSMLDVNGFNGLLGLLSSLGLLG